MKRLADTHIEDFRKADISDFELQTWLPETVLPRDVACCNKSRRSRALGRSRLGE